MRVLIADKLSPGVAPALEGAGCAVTTAVGLDAAGLCQKLAQVDPEILIVRSTKVTAESMTAAPALALIIRAGAGVNTIDLAFASSRGIYVSNCPGKNAIAVAELTMAHLLNCDRRIADNVAALRGGKWNKKEFGKARGLHGRTIALLGVGTIGREVARRALAFGMRVRGWDKVLTPELADELGIERAATPHEACRGAQALSIHLSLNAETKGLVGRELLEALAPGAYVINTSRGEVLDEAALQAAILSRGLRAGLDVFAKEPSSAQAPFEGPIGADPGVYGTHHIGASTEQAEEAVGDEAVRIIESFQKTGQVPNCVNIAARTPATHALVVRHRDEVGVLAGVLEKLRQQRINVQRVENVVFQGADAACCTIELDSRPDANLLAELRSPQIFAASVVALEE